MAARTRIPLAQLVSAAELVTAETPVFDTRGSSDQVIAAWQADAEAQQALGEQVHAACLEWMRAAADKAATRAEAAALSTAMTAATGRGTRATKRPLHATDASPSAAQSGMAEATAAAVAADTQKGALSVEDAQREPLDGPTPDNAGAYAPDASAPIPLHAAQRMREPVATAAAHDGHRPSRTRPQ